MLETRPASVRQSGSGFEQVETLDNVAIGDRGSTLFVEDLARSDFVQSAGASGDFSPIHYVEQYARELGNEGVFGQGMLIAGYAGRFVPDWFGPDTVRTFRTHFTGCVWPGDILTINGKVTGIDGLTVTAEPPTSRQTGGAVLLGEVTTTIPADFEKG